MLRYTIDIDRQACNGDQRCCHYAPKTFAMDCHGIAMVTNPSGNPPEDILVAAMNCPLLGITLHNAATGTQVWPVE